MQCYQNFADWQSKAMKVSALPAKILILLIFLGMANASQLYSYQERVIICRLPLENADAEQLADTLPPFLSPQGKISAYLPTNTLIIKDQPQMVRMLIKVIKGRENLSECQNFHNGLEANHQIPFDWILSTICWKIELCMMEKSKYAKMTGWSFRLFFSCD